MSEQLPTWLEPGVEPPEVLKTNGWQPGMKPSAQHMNWLLNRIYKCIEEIQAGGGTEELEQELATLQQNLATLQQELATHTADYLKHTGYSVATGSANTYIATLNPALSAYQEGVSLRLKINAANTGASTVNVNGLGAKEIKKSNGNDVASGNLKAGSVYTLAYDGTSFILQGEGGEYGTAGAEQVLDSHTIGTEKGVIQGTIPRKSSQTYTPSTVNQTITAGQYILGNQTILGDADLIASNIKSGVNIFGVVGTVLEGGMYFGNYDFTNKHISATGEDEKIYVVDMGVTPNRGYVYDKYMNLLQTIAGNGLDCRGLSPEAYILNVGSSRIDVYNLSGTLIGTNNITTNIGSYYSTPFWYNGAVAIAYWDGSFPRSNIVNIAGTLLASQQKDSIAPKYFRNRKGNLIMTQITSTPWWSARFDKTNLARTELNVVNQVAYSLDFKNW